MAHRNGEATAQLLRPNLNKSLPQPKPQPKSKSEKMNSFHGHPQTGLFFRSSGPSLALPRPHPWALVTAKQACLRTPLNRAKFCFCSLNKRLFTAILRVLDLTT